VRTAWLVVATIVAVAVQTTLARFVMRETVTLDLVLVVVVYAALIMGPVTGLMTGTFAGLVQDTLSSGVIGIGGLSKTLIGFLVGIVSTQFIVTHTIPRFVVFFLATIAHAVIFIGLYVLLGLRERGVPYVAVLGQATGNAIVGVVAFRLVERWPAGRGGLAGGVPKPKR
jgi:rod shape-determining protein MreD